MRLGSRKKVRGVNNDTRYELLEMGPWEHKYHLEFFLDGQLMGRTVWPVTPPSSARLGCNSATRAKSVLLPDDVILSVQSLRVHQGSDKCNCEI
jgi:hypothetical protein